MSGILQAIGAKSKPMAQPVKERTISQTGNMSKFTVIGKSCMK
jgi:hypothetical protein